LALSLALAAGIAGCRVQVDKGANGEDKTVQVDTPFGGIHVNTGQTTAADLGLPVYPGAKQVTDDDKHKSADLHLGFGEWQLRVRAVSYATADSQEKVAAFYKKALDRYGDVITCQANAPVGAPARTSEGLTCADDKNNGHVDVDMGNFKVDTNKYRPKNGLELKAGSRRHQHIVGFEEPRDGKTRFALVALDLPTGPDNDSTKSD
jgi:hypothetical protein